MCVSLRPLMCSDCSSCSVHMFPNAVFLYDTYGSDDRFSFHTFHAQRGLCEPSQAIHLSHSDPYLQTQPSFCIVIQKQPNTKACLGVQARLRIESLITFLNSLLANRLLTLVGLSFTRQQCNKSGAQKRKGCFCRQQQLGQANNSEASPALITCWKMLDFLRLRTLSVHCTTLK